MAPVALGDPSVLPGFAQGGFRNFTFGLPLPYALQRRTGVPKLTRLFSVICRFATTAPEFANVCSFALDRDGKHNYTNRQLMITRALAFKAMLFCPEKPQAPDL